jgi:hypothetical protein
MRRLALIALLTLTACGPSTPQLQLDFVLSALLADQISELQVSLISNGRSLQMGDCVTVQKTCLVGQVTTDRFIPVQDANGVEHRALRFPLNLKPSGGNSSQDFTVQGIPVGRDYALVIEALSKDSPPKLAGSSCDFVAEITAGTNPRKLAALLKPKTPPVNCDPRVEMP